MKSRKSFQNHLIFSILVIIISTSITSGQETSNIVNLNIGVSINEKYDFKINNFEDQEILIADFIFFDDYYESSNEPAFLEEIFSINITRIDSESSETVCYVISDDNCTYFTPEIYVDLTSGSSTFSGMIGISTNPFGDLITTTDWNLVEEEVMNLDESPNEFFEYEVFTNTFTKNSERATLIIDIKATFLQNDSIFPPWESIAVNGTSIYDTNSGVLHSGYTEYQFTYTNGTIESDIRDIQYIGRSGGADNTLDLPILTLNHAIVSLLILSLMFYRKRRN